MADFGPHAGDFLSTQGQAQITPNATAHAKGSWATFSGGAPTRADGFYLSPAYLGDNSTCRTILIDVGVGSGPTPIISNLMFCPPHANPTTVQRSVAEHVFFPVSLPPSESIKGRAQTNITSHSDLWVDVMPVKSGLPCVGSVVDTYGADTTNTKGTTLTASSAYGVFGSWSPITTSSERIKALIVAVGHGQADWSTYDNQWGAVQIGIGGSGAEVELIRIIEIGTGSGIRVPSQTMFGPYYVDIPAGTRVSGRAAKQYSSASQRTFDVILYGIR